MKRLYLSGAITGNPDYKKQFAEAKEKYTRPGYVVVNPAESPLDADAFSWREFIRLDLVMLEMCDAIVMLPGHEKSKGALVELNFASLIGLEIIYDGKEQT